MQTTTPAAEGPHQCTVVPRPAARGLWSGQIDGLLERVPMRQPQTYRDAEKAQALAFAAAARTVDEALANGCSVDAWRLLLQRRALARTDAELHGSRPRVEECARRIASALIAAGCEPMQETERHNVELTGACTAQQKSTDASGRPVE